jgi:hypothetical protein
MSDIGFGGVDFSLGLENLNAELAAYFATPEGQANLAASGIQAPVASAEPDYAQIVNDAYAPKYGYYTPDVGGTAGTGGGQEESEAERIARLDREAEDARRRNELAFAQQQAALQTAQRRQDARSTMASVLATYGLGDLSDYVYNEIIAKETVNINNPDAIIFAIREQPAYQKRFAGNAARLKKGLSELDPASYIGLENQFRQTLQSNGLPSNFYDQPDDFQALIEGDVSPSELNERVQQGYRAVADADPAVKEQMKNLYGIGEGELAAYFLDPQRTAPLLTRQAQAANIAARGLEQGGIQLSGTFAEDLARRGITEQQARAGFAEVGALGELRQTFAGELHYPVNNWQVRRSGLMSPRNKSLNVVSVSVLVSSLVVDHLLGQLVKHQALFLLRWVKRNSILDTVK